MNSNHGKDSGNKIMGSIKETVGKLMGNKKRENKRKIDKGEGKAQNTFGKAKDTARRHTP